MFNLQIRSFYVLLILIDKENYLVDVLMKIPFDSMSSGVFNLLSRFAALQEFVQLKIITSQTPEIIYLHYNLK